jgi:hypothetical protein
MEHLGLGKGWPISGFLQTRSEKWGFSPFLQWLRQRNVFMRVSNRHVRRESFLLVFSGSR